MPDTRLELKGLQDLILPVVQGKKLSNKSLLVQLAKTRVEKPVPIALDDVTFTVSGDADVSLFNSQDDEDPDKLVGTVIDYDANRAWLKYRVGVSAKAETSLEQSGFTLAFAGDVHPQLGSYRVHSPDESAWEAVKHDLASAHLVLSAIDIKQLKDQEALFLRAPGKLKLNVVAKWSHIISNGLGALAALLGAGQALAINVDASLALSFEVSIEDSFFVAFKRQGGDLRLVVRKSEKTLRAGKFETRVGVEFANPKAVADVLQSVIGALLEKPLDEVRNALKNKSDDDLAADKETRDLVNKLLTRLGVDAAVDKLGALREALDRLQHKAQETVEAVAKAGIAFAFTYEYSRVEENSMVLDATFPESALDAHYKQMLRGNLVGFLRDAAAEGSRIKVKSYLREDKLQTSHSYGFGLSLGKWRLFFGEDTSKRERVITSNYDIGKGSVRQKIALTEQRGYRGKWMGDAWSWMMTLQGSMEHLSAAETAAADEFKYGASVLMQRELGQVSSDERAEMLDLAVIWGVLPLEEVRANDELLAQRLASARDVTTTCELKLSDEAFRMVMDRLARRDKQGIARALAKAMPWSKAHAHIRQHVRRRQDVYAPLWLWYFEDLNAGPKDLAQSAAFHLRKVDRNLADDEGEDWTDVGRPTIAGMAYATSSLRNMWDGVGRAAEDFMRAYARARPYRQASDAMRKLRAPGEQSYWLRAFGAYALDSLDGHPGLLKGTVRTLTLEFKNGSGKKVVENITSSTNAAG